MLGEGDRIDGLPAGDAAVGPGVEDDRVLPGGAHGDEGDPAGDFLVRTQGGDVHAVRAQLLAQRDSRGIPADSPDEHCGRPAVGGGCGLIRPLAAQTVGGGGARERLARLGEAVDRDRDVLVDGTDDDDASHVELLCFGGVGRHRVDRSGGSASDGQDAGSRPKVGNALGQEVAPVGARLLGVDGDRVAVPHAGQGGEELWRHERIDSLEHACVLVCGLCLLSVVPGPVALTGRGVGVLRLRPGRRCVSRLSSLRRVCAGETASGLVRQARGMRRVSIPMILMPLSVVVT